jgi:hypothetical protein
MKNGWCEMICNTCSCSLNPPRRGDGWMEVKGAFTGFEARGRSSVVFRLWGQLLFMYTPETPTGRSRVHPFSLAVSGVH